MIPSDLRVVGVSDTRTFGPKLRVSLTPTTLDQKVTGLTEIRNFGPKSRLRSGLPECALVAAPPATRPGPLRPRSSLTPVTQGQKVMGLPDTHNVWSKVTGVSETRTCNFGPELWVSLRSMHPGPSFAGAPRSDTHNFGPNVRVSLTPVPLQQRYGRERHPRHSLGASRRSSQGRRCTPGLETNCGAPLIRPAAPAHNSGPKLWFSQTPITYGPSKVPCLT